MQPSSGLTAVVSINIWSFLDLYRTVPNMAMDSQTVKGRSGCGLTSSLCNFEQTDSMNMGHLLADFRRAMDAYDNISYYCYSRFYVQLWFFGDIHFNLCSNLFWISSLTWIITEKVLDTKDLVITILVLQGRWAFDNFDWSPKVRVTSNLNAANVRETQTWPPSFIKSLIPYNFRLLIDWNCLLDTDLIFRFIARFISSFEPIHEIMALFVLRKLILQMRMRSHPVGLDVLLLVVPFVYFHTSCVRTAKVARLRECAGSPEPSLVAYVISTIIPLAGSFYILGTSMLWNRVQENKHFWAL